MDTTRLTRVALAFVFGLTATVVAQQPEPPKLPSPPQVNVKTLTTFTAGTDHPYTGVVEKIDGTKVTVNCTGGEYEVLRPLTFIAIDAVVDGTFRKNVNPMYAYVWSDLKVGDGVDLHAVRAADDDELYCVDLCIWRRPGAKLPKSQKDKDDRDYLRRSTLNDIDNGEDVDDADVAKAFPGRVSIGPGDPGKRAGLNPEYQKKLDSIRAKKKEKEDLKATPPEKK